MKSPGDSRRPHCASVKSVAYVLTPVSKIWSEGLRTRPVIARTFKQPLSAGRRATPSVRMAGRFSFSRRLHGYTKAEGIPLVLCQAGERKHELAEEYLAKTRITQGLFLILVGRAQAPVWDISVNHHIEPKRTMPYVNHYSFHILDPEWGHITIKISGHPPFPTQKRSEVHQNMVSLERLFGL